jgi:hypothetical protein
MPYQPVTPAAAQWQFNAPPKWEAEQAMSNQVHAELALVTGKPCR